LFKNGLLTFVLGCLLLVTQGCQAQTNIKCELDNDDLRSMPKALVTFTRADGSTFDVQVKAALNGQTRAAGFQRVCQETVSAEPILFVFESEIQPSFHMNNVVATLDIAFIDQDGGIDSIQRMFPYILISTNKPLYSPKGPVKAALETHLGFFKKHELDINSTLTWRLL